MSGTDSLIQPSPSPSQAELNEEATRDAMAGYEGVRRLGFMVGIKSNNRNLKTEDDAYARSLAAGDLITPEVAAVTQPGDDVEAMAARDITINHNYPAPAMQPTTPPVTPAPTTSLVKKAAIAAALVGGGAAAPLLYQYFNQEPKAAVIVAPDYDPAALDLLPPDPAPVN